MILIWLILIPAAAGLLAWPVGRVSPLAARWLCLGAMIATLALAGWLWAATADHDAAQGHWLAQFRAPWIPQWGAEINLRLDGLSLLLVLLTGLLGVMAVLCSWSEIQDRVGLFHLNLMWMLAGLMGVFLALDLFLFYFFFELMLVPLYFLIAIWGHERRRYAAIKFFIFTQVSGLFMLAGILALYFIHGRQHGGEYTFDYVRLLGTSMSPTSAWLIMGTFFLAFAVKLPAVPLHTWLPDAHTEAPTAGSVALAGLLLKVGAYGLLRFLVPLFPVAARDFAPLAQVLGVVGILYGAVMAFAQRDLKRLVAYSSISHMGFVLLGVFSWHSLAMAGAMVVILAHGVSTGALFILAGQVQERTGTRDLDRLGGLWETAPRLGGSAMLFVLASLGLPGLGNFIGEFLVLVGTFQTSPVLTIVAAGGMVMSAIYSLWLVQRIFHGPNREAWRLPDLNFREGFVYATLIVAILWLGLYPRPFLDTFKPAGQWLRQASGLEVAPRPPQGQSGEPIGQGPEGRP